MAFGVRAYDIPSVRSYQHAKDMFEKLTPIRGGDQSVRRFVRRNDRVKLLKQEIVEGIETYVFSYYQSDLVRMYPTHMEISLCGWFTNSTFEFIYGLTNLSISTPHLSKLIPAGFSGLDAGFQATVNGYPINVHDTYKFGYDGHPIEGQQFAKAVKYRVNRKRMNEARAPYKPFKTYATAMAGLIDVTNDEIREDMEKRARDLQWFRNFDMHALDEANYWNAFCILASDAIQVSWSWNGYHSSRETVLSVKRMHAKLDNFIKSHNQDVLDAVPLN